MQAECPSKQKIPSLPIRSSPLFPPCPASSRHWRFHRWKNPSLFTQPNSAHCPGPVLGRGPSLIPGDAHALVLGEKAATCTEHLLYAWPQVRPPETTTSDALLVREHGSSFAHRRSARGSREESGCTARVLCIFKAPVGRPEPRTPGSE